ncbi:plexin domain-containing protein 2-like [Carassius auratus]|uniref:Plexin domain-containing protein 2-like n=1 Tax=Carassius auratus TaxID=7957 RepID=A0A6P6RC22_CARAU|nr:plexin domain-containing protein 2-like [Carassius auratus]
MLSSKPVDEISQNQDLERYEEHSRLDSERFPEGVTNQSHDNLSIKRDMDHIYNTFKFYGTTDSPDKYLWRVNLNFNFPFYGHSLRKMVLTSIVSTGLTVGAYLR